MSFNIKSWLKPNLKQCPCCLLVLNQETCAFPKGITDYLLHNGTDSKDIPKNVVLCHHAAGPEIFTQDTLPVSVTLHRLTTLMRNHQDSRPIPNTEVIDLTTARGTRLAKTKLLVPSLQAQRICTLLQLEVSDLEHKADKMEKRLAHHVRTLSSIQHSLMDIYPKQRTDPFNSTFINSIIEHTQKAILSDISTSSDIEPTNALELDNDLSTTALVMKNIAKVTLTIFAELLTISHSLVELNARDSHEPLATIREETRNDRLVEALPDSPVLTRNTTELPSNNSSLTLARDRLKHQSFTPHTLSTQSLIVDDCETNLSYTSEMSRLEPYSTPTPRRNRASSSITSTLQEEFSQTKVSNTTGAAKPSRRRRSPRSPPPHYTSQEPTGSRHPR